MSFARSHIRHPARLICTFSRCVALAFYASVFVAILLNETLFHLPFKSFSLMTLLPVVSATEGKETIEITMKDNRN